MLVTAFFCHVGTEVKKVRANWKKWGLPELNDPNTNPTWRYFETTGAGETGRRG